jgi:hypothetical protein
MCFGIRGRTEPITGDAAHFFAVDVPTALVSVRARRIVGFCVGQVRRGVVHEAVGICVSVVPVRCAGAFEERDDVHRVESPVDLCIAGAAIEQADPLAQLLPTDRVRALRHALFAGKVGESVELIGHLGGRRVLAILDRGGRVGGD